MIFPVSPKKNEDLQQAMARLGIRESDLEESFIASGGPGGQNVNKVATCVVLRYSPAGIIVKCQKERSQAMNRYYARRILLEKMDALIRGRESEEAKRVSKIRRQKRKRSKRAKDKMLASKKLHGDKKRERKRVGPQD